MTIPAQYNQLMPYLIVEKASTFLEFTKVVFGATDQLRVPNPDGSVKHGELRIGEAVIMYSDATTDMPPAPAGLCLLVEDAVATYHKGLENGAVSIQAPEDREYGKSAGFRDAYGNNWWLMEGMK